MLFALAGRNGCQVKTNSIKASKTQVKHRERERERERDQYSKCIVEAALLDAHACDAPLLVKLSFFFLFPF